MPYLSKVFNHTIDDISSNEWTYEKSTDEIITYSNWVRERKGYTAQFFTDLKEMLEQTNLSITFDDEAKSFNVFDIDFILKCISSGTDSYWTNTNHNSGVRPAIILPRIENAADTNNSNTTIYNTSLDSFGYKAMNETAWTTLNGSNHWINRNSNDCTLRNQVSYTIKIYYNTNYIICHYTSFEGYDVPLFCLVQGEIVATKEKAVYLSSCINNNNTFVFHKIAIPSQNKDKSKYYDYLPCINNSTKLNTLFDSINYPSSEILSKLSMDGNVNGTIYLNKVTAFGGLISFDNVFDVTRINSSNLPTQIQTKSLYTINDENYYCPGCTASGYDNDASTNGRYIFKL